MSTEVKTWFGHPRGLAVLFFTETWERFSYYGMRVLLILYMTKYLFVDPEKGRSVFGYEYIVKWVAMTMNLAPEALNVQTLSSNIYGLYTGAVYLSPLFGGYLADRFWGAKRSVYLGSILMGIGHFLMVSESAFFVALLFLILGNGCFKPCISTQVASLYKDDDPKKDSAFMVFYMGVNLGAFLSPLVCGYLGQTYGWHYGFSAAGVGMILGLIVYHFGQSWIVVQSHSAIVHSKDDEKQATLSAQDKTKMVAFAVLCLVNILFWALYEQQGNTTQLWVDESLDWNIWGWTMPSAFYQSLNPLIIFTFTPLLVSFWAWQRSRGKEPSSVTKMGIGCLLLGLSYVILIIADKSIPVGEKGSLMWAVEATFILTLGELYLSPIGLSLVSKISPRGWISTLMGFWYLSSSFGNTLSGYIGGFYSLMPKNAFFTMLVAIGALASLVLFVGNKPLKRAIGSNV